MFERGWFILDGKETKPIEDLMDWAEFMGNVNRRVAFTKIKGVQISTVFLGLDHSFEDGPPLLFETMVFGGKLNGEMNRYSTWKQAKKGHKEMVDKIKRGGGKDPNG